MPFNGSGTYNFPSLPGSFNPAISGQQATPDDWNTLASDLTANGLTNCITKDGQQTVTADIPFANFRLKLVGNATLLTDAPNLGQIQSGAGVYAADTGAADAYVIAPSPAISAYAVGQISRWKVANTNLTTTPTLAINGLTAGIIDWSDGSILLPGVLVTDALVQTIVASVTTGTPTFHLQTPVPVGPKAPTTQNFTSGSAATYTTPVGAKWIKVRMVGGGGGGGGLGATTGPDGDDGGDSIFNSINAKGGGGGGGVTTFASGTPGTGGTGGSGSATLRVAGQAGGQAAITSGSRGNGAPGGSAPFFGGGAQAVASETTTVMDGNDAVANTGGGGSGGIVETASALGPSGGGGAGEYLELIISSPSATYSYTVGASGAGGIGTGISATTGGAGAAGFITVEEHYNW